MTGSPPDLLHDAIAVQATDGPGGGSGAFAGAVYEGWDIFGNAHGGYMMAQAANVALQATGQPDVMSITSHFLRKAVYGPIRYATQVIGASRRFTSLAVHGLQDDQAVTTSLVLLADRRTFEGPRWSSREDPGLPDRPLSPPADAASGLPRIAQQLGLRILMDDAAFAVGGSSGTGLMRAVVDPPAPTVTDQLLAIVACDLTPPAVWNAGQPMGWVPTVELSAQLRVRPAPGPLSVVARSTDMGEGFVDEEAEVYDSSGRLVVHSLQHARISQPR